jgi:hypothetical protein
MRGPTFGASIALLIAGLAVTGCGSSKPTITKAQFVAKANAICAKGNEKVATVEKGFNEKTTAAEFEAFVKNTLAPNIQAQIDGVRALGTPSGEEKTVTNMLNIAEMDLNQVKSQPKTMLASNAKPFANFAEVAHHYGLTNCAQKE